MDMITKRLSACAPGKRRNGHHLPCLSSLSQAPLISADIGSEQSTPISAHSLSHPSPIKVSVTTQSQQHSHHQHQHQQQHMQQPLAPTHMTTSRQQPLTPTSASCTSKPPPLHFSLPTYPTSSTTPSSANLVCQQAAGSFFPFPSRTGSVTNHQPQTAPESNFAININAASNQSCASGSSIGPGTCTNKRNDFSMNIDHSTDRESTPCSPNLVLPIHARRTSTARVRSSPLNSPVFASAGLHQPDLQSQSFFLQPLQPRRLSTLPPTPTKISNNNNNTTSNNNHAVSGASKESDNSDNNYHLYHEPEDPDEQADKLENKLSVFKNNNNHSPSATSVSQATNDDLMLCLSAAQSRLNLSASSNRDNNNAQFFNRSSESLLVNDQLKQQSPEARVTPYVDRMGTSGKDISADIYFCYVQLKSTERSNHRSRSYHGPKKTNNNIPSLASLSISNTSKNLSTTSVTELPQSQNVPFVNTMIPVHFRDHCVRELIETESNYVHALEMILNGFAGPLEPFIKRDEYQLIFGHIKYFYHVHSAFQADLVKAAFKSSSNSGSIKMPSSARSTSNSSMNTKQQASSNPPTPTTFNNQKFFNGSIVTFEHTEDAINTGQNTKSSSIQISSCFLKAKEKFLRYGEYCASLARTQILLDELASKSDLLACQLDRCQQEVNDGKFKLRDLLSLPMQRVLKYHLLLAQLIKQSSLTNDDYQGLKRAYEAMLDLNQYINEVKRDTEALEIINEIEQSIVGLNLPNNTRLSDYGRLITDGFLRVKSPFDNKQTKMHDTKLKLSNDIKLKQKRYVFVFDKVMLICKLGGVRETTYQYKEALVLSDFEIESSPVVSTCDATTGKHTKEKWAFNFNLIHTDDNSTYNFCAKTQDMKSKWITYIQKAIENTRPQLAPVAHRNNNLDTTNQHEFSMHTFERASSCDHCGKLLLGLYYQGYRCKMCLTSVHKKCMTSVKSCGPTLPAKTGNSYANCEQDLTQLDPSNDYVNFILNDRPWFGGRLDRERAQTLLKSMPHGTFMVRVSPNHNGSYVISLNHESRVKHIRIYVSKTDNQLYLSQNRYFHSVTELIAWYEKNSLIESFELLDARLAIPFKTCQV